MLHNIVRKVVVVACLATTAFINISFAKPALDGARARSAPSSITGESYRELSRLLAAGSNATPVRVHSTVPAIAPKNAFERLILWHDITLDTTAIDHTPVVAGSTEDPRRFAEQLGPHRASRAVAITEIAVFEAVNAIKPRYKTIPQFKSYTGIAQSADDTTKISIDQAIARAAYDTLTWLYPYQQPRLDALFAADTARISGDPAAIAAGDAVGARAAASIIALRTNDGSETSEVRVGTGPDDYHLVPGPGNWSQDPVSNLQVALGYNWNKVKPFVMGTADQFRVPPPPALTDPAYTVAYNAAKNLGGDPNNGTATTRTADQTFSGKLWGYDGTPSLCAPPRLYNQMARKIAIEHHITNVNEMARFLAVMNVAMADAGIAAWDSKWYYHVWRPITAIRAGDADTNPATAGDAAWYPLGAPATNSRKPNFTPPFPAYPSGHATFGGSVFETLRQYWPDATPFTLISDEYNGKNADSVTGKVRKYTPVRYNSFKDAEFDNAESRIYLGIHWQFDADNGIAQGNQIARYVFANAFQRIHAGPTPPNPK